MSQHDMNLANAAGATFRADANNALVALAGCNSGATEPATMYAFQLWADTTAGMLKQRNALNNAWITLFTLAGGPLDKAGGNMSGGFNAKLSVVASATTPDIFATTVGNLIDYTGTATCTGLVAAPQAGAERTLVCAAAAVFTAGANMIIDGTPTGNFTAVAGDKIRVRATTTTQFRLTPERLSGAPTITPGASGNLLTSNGTAWTSSGAGVLALKSATTTVDVGSATAPTAGQVLKATSATAATWQTPPGITLHTEQATTSGTEFDFTSIPAGTKRITINFKGVSLNNSGTMWIRLGTGGTPETSGYIGYCGEYAAGYNEATAFRINGVTIAASLYSGSVILTLENAATNSWCIGGAFGYDSATYAVAGSKSLAGALDMIRILNSAGHTWDAGAVNITYE